MAKQASSWEPVAGWYDESVGQKGDFTHRAVVIPKTIRLLAPTKESKILDLGCGQGILGRELGYVRRFTGVDISPSLIAFARKRDTHPSHRYFIADATKPLPVAENDFTHVSAILMMDNVKNPDAIIQTAKKHLLPGGIFVFVINHPAFRIPRQSTWDIDMDNKIQSRKINRYLSPLSIPITLHPSKGASSPITWTYHFPISTYVQWLCHHGFVVERLEEWIWEKTSTGKSGKMENRARAEFPLFLAIRAKYTFEE